MATTELMRLDSSGNLGIGTSSPGQKLDVSGSAQSSNWFINGNAGTYGFSDSSASIITYNATGSGGITKTLRFVTNGAEQMRIDSSGNVGIGNTNPTTAKLVVNTSSIKSGFFTQTVTANPANVDAEEIFTFASNSGISGLTFAAGDARLLTYGVYTDNTMYVRANGLSLLANNANLTANAGTYFSVGTGTTGYTERMRITSTGLVGIGTTSPSTLLHVSGTDSGPTALRLQNTTATTGNTWQIGSTNTGLLQLATRPGVADYMTLDATGNLGIGVFPYATAGMVFAKTYAGLVYSDIANYSTTNSSDGVDLRLITQNVAGSGTTSVDFVKTKNGAFSIINNETNSAAYMVLGVNGERMRINSSGNVGIGVTNAEIFGYVTEQGGYAATSWSNLAVQTPSDAQGRVADISFYSTFQGTADNGCRRTADILAGFNGGAWGSEYLSFNVGNNGGGNDTRVLTSEKMRITNAGNVIVTNSGGGLGYGTGSGGTVTQATSKTTSVTLNKPTGQITMNNAALAAGATVGFTCNNSIAAIGDNIIVNLNGGLANAAGNYSARAASGSGAIFFVLKNESGGSLSEAVILNFSIIRGSTS